MAGLKFGGVGAAREPPLRSVYELEVDAQAGLALACTGELEQSLG